MALKEVFPNFWRGSEEDAYLALKAGRLVHFRTIICFRRKIPVWWSFESSKAPKTKFLHFAIPPSVNPSCSGRIQEFFGEVLPNVSLPVLFFCKEGKHRTGMVAALIKSRRFGRSEDALKEYMGEVLDSPREGEITIIEKLSQSLQKLNG